MPSFFVRPTTVDAFQWNGGPVTSFLNLLHFDDAWSLPDFTATRDATTDELNCDPGNGGTTFVLPIGGWVVTTTKDQYYPDVEWHTDNDFQDKYGPAADRP